MKWTEVSRRKFLTTTALAGAAVAAPYVKTAHSAGKLSLGMWDHWVPGSNEVLRQMATEWAKKNNVELTLDFITSNGDKLLLTGQAEARAKTGHDILSHPTWQVAVHQDSLEPIDEIVKQMEAKYGPYNETAAFLGKFKGTWKGIAAATGSHSYPMQSRLDLFKQHAGIDLRDMFPAGPRDKAKVENWNYDTFLVAAEKLHKAGKPFGNPLGQTSDSQDWTGPLFLSYGSTMIDKDGNVTVDSDATRQALDYMKKLTQFMPKEIYAWDDAGNNRWIISGNGSSIQNPPSSWAVASRDAPDIGKELWHHDTPRGPKGRFRGSLPYLYGIWSFSPNKPQAKDFLLWVLQKEQVAKLLDASRGYDLPLQESFYDHPVWQKEGPPTGGLYNYPIRGDEKLIVAGWPAPPKVAAQIYNQALIPNMIARVTQGGMSAKDAIAWASGELEGYLRT